MEAKNTWSARGFLILLPLKRKHCLHFVRRSTVLEANEPDRMEIPNMFMKQESACIS